MNKKINSGFVEEISAVLAVPEIAPAFDARLEAHLIEKIQTEKFQWRQNTKPAKRRPVYAIPVCVVLLLSLIVLAVGPQKVLAAVRNLSFLQGFGYVQDAVHVLDEPVQVERDGVTVDVYEGVTDSQHSWLRIAINGVDEAIEPYATECQLRPYLVLDDGTFYYHEWSSLHTTEDEVIMETSFPALPQGTEKATLVIPCVPNLPSPLNEEDWIFDLSFRIPVEGEEPLPAEPVFIPTAVPEAEDETLDEEENSSAAEASEGDLNVQLVVDNVVEWTDGYQFQGYVWRPENPHFGFLMEDLSLYDANGEQIAIQPVDVSFGSNVPAGAQPWVVRTTTKDLTPEMIFKLKAISLSQSDYGIKEGSITVDLGSDPQVGQNWVLDERIKVAGYDVNFHEVRLEQLAPEIYLLSFDVTYSPENIQSLTLADADAQTAAVMGGGGGGGDGADIRLETIGYTSLPSGIRTIYVKEAYIVQDGGWSTTIKLPKK